MKQYSEFITVNKRKYKMFRPLAATGIGEERVIQLLKLRNGQAERYERYTKSGQTVRIDYLPSIWCLHNIVYRLKHVLFLKVSSPK